MPLLDRERRLALHLILESPAVARICVRPNLSRTRTIPETLLENPVQSKSPWCRRLCECGVGHVRHEVAETVPEAGTLEHLWGRMAAAGGPDRRTWGAREGFRV